MDCTCNLMSLFLSFVAFCFIVFLPHFDSPWPLSQINFKHTGTSRFKIGISYVLVAFLRLTTKLENLSHTRTCVTLYLKQKLYFLTLLWTKKKRILDNVLFSIECFPKVRDWSNLYFRLKKKVSNRWVHLNLVISVYGKGDRWRFH